MGRNFDRAIETASQAAFEQGKAAEIERRAVSGNDPLVYKQVQPGACKHCISLYVTKGIGSQPLIFKLSQLRGSGSNIGRKTEDWKATIEPAHPSCRCPLYQLAEGYLWNKETQSFSIPAPGYTKGVAARQAVNKGCDRGQSILFMKFRSASNCSG